MFGLYWLILGVIVCPWYILIGCAVSSLFDSKILEDDSKNILNLIALKIYGWPIILIDYYLTKIETE